MRLLVGALLGAAAAGGNYYLVGDPLYVVKSPFYGAEGIDAERRQELILATDPIGPGRVTKLEWYGGAGVATGKFYKFKVYLCDTTRSALGSSFADNYDGRTPTLVYAADPLTITLRPLSWTGFALSTPYDLNPAHNLLLETWWEGDDGAAGFTFATVVGGQLRDCAAHVVDGVPKYGYPSAGKVGRHLHYVRLTVTFPDVEATSWGRLRVMFR